MATDQSTPDPTVTGGMTVAEFDIAEALATYEANLTGLPAGTVPVTAFSRFQRSFPGTLLAFAKQVMFPPTQDRALWWWVAVDLSEQLKVVVNTVTYDSHGVPTEVERLKGDARYFLFVIGSNLVGGLIPQGEMYDFLRAIGSGRVLANVEQVVSQIGTGSILSLSYILAATTQEHDLNGFEAYSDVGKATLVMQFIPVKVDEKIIYAPIQQ